MDSSLKSRSEHFSKRYMESDEVLGEPGFFTSLSCKRHCREALAHRDLVDILETDDIHNRSTDDYLITGTQEELFCEVIRSLEEEIGASGCSDSSQYSMEGLLPSGLESSCFSLHKDGSPTSKICNMCFASSIPLKGCEDNKFTDDISFLLEASDDELGIFPSICYDSVESCDESGSALETICQPEEDSVIVMESWQSKSVWPLDSRLGFSCADDYGDQEWLKMAISSLEILTLPSFTQSSIQSCDVPVLEVGVDRTCIDRLINNVQC